MVDMRFACPKDVKKMLLKQSRAKHVYEELKEGMWLEPTLAMLRRRTKEVWTDKHHNIARKLIVEGGWVQTFRYWLVKRKQVPRMSQTRRHGEAQALPVPRLE